MILQQNKTADRRINHLANDGGTMFFQEGKVTASSAALVVLGVVGQQSMVPGTEYARVVERTYVWCWTALVLKAFLQFCFPGFESAGDKATLHCNSNNNPIIGSDGKRLTTQANWRFSLMKAGSIIW